MAPTFSQVLKTINWVLNLKLVNLISIFSQKNPRSERLVLQIGRVGVNFTSKSYPAEKNSWYRFLVHPGFCESMIPFQEKCKIFRRCDKKSELKFRVLCKCQQEDFTCVKVFFKLGRFLQEFTTVKIILKCRPRVQKYNRLAIIFFSWDQRIE